MSKFLSRVFATITLLCVATGAWADPVAEVFECELEKGKTIADAQEINKNWLAFMKSNVSEEISSVAATAVVGNSDEFMYVDTYPDLKTWAAGKEALATDEGQAVSNDFDDVMECDKNRLYRLRRTE